MLRVREIMTPHVVTLSPDATLREAIETLVSCRIGGAPVLDGTKVVGVLSAPDVLEFESETPDTRHGDEEASEGTMLEPAEEWMEGDDAPAAFFTDLWGGPDTTISDLSPEGDQWNFLNEHSVAEAMSRSVCTLPANLEVSAGAQRMLAAGVQRALVTEDDDLIGILTTTDILRAVAERRLSMRQYVFD
ncbi:MAG TPA: CBS domain-containing protein [Gemmatimonadaceae bacterium]